jgi:hypothetical protein
VARKAISSSGRSEERQTVVFEYIKSPLFRVIHADGAIGGITPTGNVHVAFHSDRPAIPRTQVFHRNSDGTLGDIIPEHTVTRPGIIREMDVDVILSESSAVALRDWLTGRIDDLRATKNQLRKIARKKPK